MSVPHEVLFETVEYETESLYRFISNYQKVGFPVHWHNAVEIIMPIDGDYRVTVGIDEYHLMQHEILIIPSGELHEIHTMETNGARVILQFDATMFNIMSGFTDIAYVYSKVWYVSPNVMPELHDGLMNRLLEIQDEYLARRPHYNASIISKIVSIAIGLARTSQEGETFYLVKRRKRQLDKFNACINYIYQNYTETLTLETVATAIGYSKFHFSRWFQQFAGLPFYDYLLKIRLDKAKADLLNTDKSITEIALSAGFQSIVTFNRIFKEKCKCTPTEYRSLSREFPVGTDSEEADESPQETVLIRHSPALQHVVSGAALPGTSGVESGMFRNPFLWADVPDPCVIRVGDCYYMTSTTMYFNPGCPVMRSYDLVNWETISYVYDILDDSCKNSLRNGESAYGKGSWASSLRYNNGIFYVFFASFSTGKSYIFQTDDIENGRWERYTLDKVFHDASLLFDDGKVYLAYGGGAIRIIELTGDATAIKPGGVDRVLIEKTDVGGSGGLPAEGAHFYKINGWYYVFLIAWPPKRETASGRRIQLCYRAKSLNGPFEGRVILDDDMGYRNMGVAQGGIIDTPDGQWFALLFQDHGAVGRCPVLVPMTWTDGWPVLGEEGRVPSRIKLPVPGRDLFPITVSDEFYRESAVRDYSALNDRSYQYAHPGDNNDESRRDSGLGSDNTKTHDVELLVNGNFAEGLQHWSYTDIAKLSIVNDAEIHPAPVMRVSSRVTTGSGLMQNITGKAVQGGVYQVSARVKYIDGTEEKDFLISMYKSEDWQTIVNIGAGRVKKGEWGVINGTYTIPADENLEKVCVFIETPYVPVPKKDLDIMDYYIESFSLKAKHSRRLTHTMPGENDPNGWSLPLQWQFNHNPDNNLWSLTERPGFLRLKSGYLRRGLTDARNTLTQRTFGPVCGGTVALETAGMNDGDFAGIAALQHIYGYVGVRQENSRQYVIMRNTTSGSEVEAERIPLDGHRVYLRVDFDFTEDRDTARFYYSLDEIHWQAIGDTVNMAYKLEHFTGYRFALFYFSTQVDGGYADFDYFRVDDKLMGSRGNGAVLQGALSSSVTGDEVEVTVKLDALPEGRYNGLYFSMHIPPGLTLDDVIFCDANIIGNPAYSVANNRLLISVTGDTVLIRNKAYDLFVVLYFNVDGGAALPESIVLRPDYIYVDGGSASYDVHAMQTVIDLP